MNDRKLLVYAIGGVIAAVIFLLLTLELASDPNVKANLGESQFRVGRADVLAREIADRGPLLFQDPTGHGRNVNVSHSGTDVAKGWAARPVGSPASEYPTRVIDGQVVVDLRAGTTPSPPSTTESPNSTRN